MHRFFVGGGGALQPKDSSGVGDAPRDTLDFQYTWVVDPTRRPGSLQVPSGLFVSYPEEPVSITVALRQE